LFHILFELYLVQQTVIGSNLALLSLTNAGFVLIHISSKSYCLSVLITSNVFRYYACMEYFSLQCHFSIHVCIVQ